MNDRRHELQQNDLAMYLDRINRAIEPYSKLIAVVVGGVFIAAIGWMLYSSQQTGERSDATLNLIEAMNSQDTEVLESVSNDFPNTLAGDWAKIYQANQFLSDGIDALFTDRENAVQLLEDSKIAYENALAGSDDPLLISRGHFGLARAHESLGELDQAIEQYKKTIAIAESDAMIEKSEERIAALGKPSTTQFLAWFADQDFSPADPSLPPSLPGGDSLPDLPDLDLPSLDLPKLDLPGGGGDNAMKSDADLELPDDEDAETGVRDELTAETEMNEVVVEPAADEAATAEPATAEPATAEPATAEPEPKEPATEEPATEEPATEEPVVEETTDDEASVEK